MLDDIERAEERAYEVGWALESLLAAFESAVHECAEISSSKRSVLLHKAQGHVMSRYGDVKGVPDPDDPKAPVEIHRALYLDAVFRDLAWLTLERYLRNQES